MPVVASQGSAGAYLRLQWHYRDVCICRCSWRSAAGAGRVELSRYLCSNRLLWTYKSISHVLYCQQYRTSPCIPYSPLAWLPVIPPPPTFTNKHHASLHIKLGAMSAWGTVAK
jgi:hypothetical protein